jgi:hypothetical protein
MTLHAAWLLLGALALGRDPLVGDAHAGDEWQPPVPQDGIEHPAPGLLAMPRELDAWGARMRRRAHVEATGVSFRYMAEREGVPLDAPGTITVHSYRGAGQGHAALTRHLRQPNMSRTPWTSWYERADLPDVVFRRRGKSKSPSYVGVVRHTYFVVQAHGPETDGEPEADVQRRARAADDAARRVVAAIQAAGSALAQPPHTIGEVRLERVPAPASDLRDTGTLLLTVLPTAACAASVESLTLLLCWRLPGDASPWRAQRPIVAWSPGVPREHGRAQPFALHPSAADDARLELMLLRAHDDAATFALEVVRFELAQGASTTAWPSPR